MFSRTLKCGLLVLSAGVLAACEPEPKAPATPELLDGLPLTPEARTTLEADLARIAAARGQGCTDREIDFASLSITLFAVGADPSAIGPWRASERARVDALYKRWEALGGDEGDISASCRNRLSSL